MFTATFKDVKPFLHLVCLLKDVVTEGVLQCRTDGLRLQAMDASHVALCAFELSANAFSTYHCEQTMFLGMSFPILHTILKACKTNDTLTLQAFSADKLDLSFTNKNNNRNATYTMHLMQIDTEELAFPLTPYPTTVKMSSVQLHDTFKDLAIMGDTCEMTSCCHWVQFVTSGDNGRVKLCIHHQPDTQPNSMDCVHITAATDRPITSTFALKYLLMFSRAHSIDERVVIHLDEDMPMKFVYRLGEYGEVSFYIAPRCGEA